MTSIRECSSRVSPKVVADLTRRQGSRACHRHRKRRGFRVEPASGAPEAARKHPFDWHAGCDAMRLECVLSHHDWFAVAVACRRPGNPRRYGIDDTGLAPAHETLGGSCADRSSGGVAPHQPVSDDIDDAQNDDLSNMTMASHGLHPALDLRLSAGLRQTCSRRLRNASQGTAALIFIRGAFYRAEA